MILYTILISKYCLRNSKESNVFNFNNISDVSRWPNVSAKFQKRTNICCIGLRQHNLIPRNKTFLTHLRPLISSSGDVINMFAKTKITVYKNVKICNARNRRHSSIVWCKISIIKWRRSSPNKKPVWLRFIYFKLPNRSPLINSIKCWEDWVSIIDDVKNGVNF